MSGRKPYRLLAIAAAVLGVAGLAASAIMAPGLPREGGSGISVVAARSVPVTVAPVHVAVAPPVPAGPPPTYIATVAAATSYSTTPGGPAAGSLAAANPFGTPDVFAVIGDPAASPGWLHIELPIRPNGSTGWIRAAGVQITQTTYKVAVSIAGRSLTVTKAGKVVLTTSVAVGAPATPTPVGNTYLWELIRPDDPNGAYGPYIFGLAWFSDAYAVFNGGDAQIGIHGQDEPWSIGQAASHGCVRLPNTTIAELADMLPLGTPVSIS